MKKEGWVGMKLSGYGYSTGQGVKGKTLTHKTIDNRPKAEKQRKKSTSTTASGNFVRIKNPFFSVKLNFDKEPSQCDIIVAVLFCFILFLFGAAINFVFWFLVLKFICYCLGWQMFSLLQFLGVWLLANIIVGGLKNILN